MPPPTLGHLRDRSKLQRQSISHRHFKLGYRPVRGRPPTLHLGEPVLGPGIGGIAVAAQLPETEPILGRELD